MTPLFWASVAIASELTAEPAAAAPVATAEPQAEEPAPVEEVVYPFELGTCSPDQPHFELELLYAEQKYDEGLERAKSLIASAPDKDLYWIAARFMFEIGEKFQRTDGAVDKEAWYQQMLDTVEQGIAMAPDDPHLRFARGIAMGRLGTTRGVMSSLFMAKDVESDWLSVANHPTFRYTSIGRHEDLPCDAYHALGIYYRLVPDWWIVQVLAGTRGDLGKSLEWHQKAVKCRPDQGQNWKELGVTQLCLGEKNGDAAMIEAGKQSLQKVTTLSADSPREKIDQKHAKMLIADPSLACEYSRDGQQELDEEKLER